MRTATIILIGICAVCAAPERVLVKDEVGPRYQHVAAPDGVRLEDSWLKTSDVAAAARFDPNVDVGFHLFTRANPNLSQPIVLGFPTILQATNYDASKKTVVLLHGWLSSPTSDFNVYTVNAFLVTEDVNVISVDWSSGAAGSYVSAIINCISAAEATARFITWLNQASGSTVAQYHLVGFSLGAQQVGIIGRNLGGQVPYISALDPPSLGWLANPNSFRSDDGIYTEVIHTSSGIAGYLTPVGDVDFYPNGGRGMPNCSNQDCDHHQCIFYFAESVIHGGFTALKCPSFVEALAGTCTGPETLQMGGLIPKTGTTGVYYLETNGSPPYSKG